MAQRRREDDWIWPVAQLFALLVALGVIYPPLRQVVVGLGWSFALPAILVIGIVLLIGIHKLGSKSGTSGQDFTFQTAPQAPAAAPYLRQLKPTPSVSTPQTTRQLIDQLRSIDWFQFEQLVGLVYRKQGYVVSRRGGANPDGGIDLVIEKDGVRTAIQCKHWKTWNVGVKAVREFLGALADAEISYGLFITLGGYTGEAKHLAEKHSIEIINETGLARMLEATDARFDPAALEILRDCRKLCPKCEREMVLRTAGKGPGVGKQFWGCSAYPKCRFTMPA